MTIDQLKADSSTLLKQGANTERASIGLLLVGVGLPLQLFVLLAAAISRDPEGLPGDAPLLVALHAIANPVLDGFASYFTQLGIAWGVLPATILLALGFSSQRQWRSLAYLLSAILGASCINYTSKLAFHRARPHLWDLFYPLPSDYSFPSGHALFSMVLVVVLVSLTWGSRWCNWVIALGSLFVVGMGWTRLYLGVHYPSDVLAGWLIGLAWGIGVKLLIKPYFAQRESHSKR
jgi:undecaprenyl-diphosphatase